MTLLVFVLVLGSIAVAQDKKDSAKGASGQAVQANGDTYVIGPADVLSINVWKEPDVSGSVPVRPDGRISLPLLNDIQAAGLTPMQLTNDLSERLKQFITDPRVTVTVATMNSRRVYILGEVTRPGAVDLSPEMTVLQALTSAGGPTPYAKTSKIYVLRTQNGTQNKLPFNYKQVLKGAGTEQNILLKPGDTIVVP